MEKMRLTVPLPAATNADARPEPAFLSALAAVIGDPDPPAVRVASSLPMFLAGNRLDEFTDPGRDLVWLGSALEQLLDIQGKWKSDKLSRQIAAILTPHAAETTWAWKGQSRTGPWAGRWALEFYDHRSSIHGQPHSSTWQTWEHGLLATVVWALAAKALLADAGRYELTDADRCEIEALEGRIAGSTPLQDRWRSARDDARWSITRRHVEAYLRAADGEEQEAVVPDGTGSDDTG